ncbi:MAG: hypothetical protein ACR2ID_06870 [Chthoniobacterales bacterium]
MTRRIAPGLRRHFILVLLLILAVIPSVRAQSGLASPSPTAPIFEVRPFGPIPPPEEPPPTHITSEDEEKPFPRGGLIAGAVVVLLALLLLIWSALRAAQSSNLFGQQYRFPQPGEAKLRLGGQKSGGLMATTELPPLKK